MAFIKIETTINAPINTVWEKWTKPEHIQNWNFASPDWHCPSAKSDLQVGGEFHYEMGTKVTEQFEPENQNPEDMQQAGWQMILDNFKSYAESAI